nr:putative capsid protein [Cressdnaviricota sp.]
MIIPYNRNRALVPYSRRTKVAAFPSAVAGAYGVAKYAARKIFGSKQAANATKVVSTVYAKRALKKKWKAPIKKNSKKALIKRVQRVEKKVAKLDSLHTFKKCSVGTLDPAQNVCKWADNYRCTGSDIETAFAGLRYYDPATPGTLITAALGTGTFCRQFLMNCYAQLIVKNNALIPADVIVYLAKAKQSTSTSVTSAMDGALADLGGVVKESTMIFMKDCMAEVRPYWDVKVAKKVRLQPGAEIKLTYNTGEFEYDPATFDLVSSTYNPDYKTFGWIIRTQGVLAHDKTTTTNVGTSSARVDYYLKEVYSCKYNSGGPELETILVSDGLTAMAAGPVVSQLSMRNQELALGAV